MSRFHRLFALVTVAAMLAVAGTVIACPTCGEALMQNDPHAQSLAAGYKYSILFMLTMPYLCLGTLGSIAYYSIRRAKLQAEAEQATGAMTDDPTAPL